MVLKVLQDAGWVSILVAIVIAIVGWYFQRKRKGLSYQVVSKYPLVFVTESDRRVEVIYDGQVVIEPTILILRVRNSGNEPIRLEDFDRRIQFFFGEGSEIISASAMDVTPAALDVQIEVHERSVAVEPLLLNAGDAFSIRILLENHSTMLASARVAGVKDFKETRERDSDAKYFGILTSLMVASLLGLATLPEAAKAGERPWEAAVSLGIGLIAAIGMLYLLLLRHYRRLARRGAFHSRPQS